MRRTSFLLVLVTIVLAGSWALPATAYAQGTPAFDVAGTDAKQVGSFLKALQSAVAIDNRLKVASLVEYPVQVRIDGSDVTIKNDSELQRYYSQIFDASMKQAIATAKVESLSVNQKGVMFDGGRVWFRPVEQHKNALKIVAFNQPQ
jgi:phage-related minor tail protein